MFWTKAVVANPQGTHRGKVSNRVREVLGPNQAMQINCRNIFRLINPPHELCEGKRHAQAVLKEALLHTDTTATDLAAADALSSAINDMIRALEQAIRFEKEGELREALVIERKVAQQLKEIIARAEMHGNERLVEALKGAHSLVIRCIRVLAADLGIADDVDPVNARLDTILHPIADGFVVVETPGQLEVTGVYRAKSHNKTVAGGVGSGISIEVVQVRPHRVNVIGPLPIEPTDRLDDTQTRVQRTTSNTVQDVQTNNIVQARQTTDQLDTTDTAKNPQSRSLRASR